MKIKFNSITKKALVILCTFVMTLTTVTAAGTLETEISELSDKELYAIELLHAVGIYDGVDSITGKDAFVRRDVMAYLAARIMGMSNATHQGESFFEDVDKNNFAYNAINVLAQMNIIKGNSDGKFYPAKDITLEEATGIILRLMGYSDLLDMQGSKAYIDLLQKHKLHKGIEYAKDKRLQVKYLSILLYNALNTEFPQVVYMNGGLDVEYRIEKGETLLKKTFDVYEVEGVISSNEHTSVDVVSNSGKGWVKIGNEMYQVGETDADKYIGYYVTAYYRQDEANTLLCIDVESTNTVVVLDGEDVVYENFQYTAYENGKKKIYDVSKGLNLIYNGEAIYYDKNKMTPYYGTITLINNNKDEAYDTVIVNSVRNVVVGSYGSISNTIQSKYDKWSINLNDVEYSMHKADGKTYKPSSLKEWDVLSVLESADKKHFDITVSNETVSGSVEKISDIDGTPVVTINGIEYEVAKTFYEKESSDTENSDTDKKNENYDLTIGYTGTFYLDIFGRIAAANGTTNQIKWGYLIKASRNTEGEDNFIVRMLTQDSSEVKYLKTADKLFVNNQRHVYTTNPEETLTQNAQVVRYTLDKEGKIKKLYTVDKGFVQVTNRMSRGFVSNVFVQNDTMDIAVDSKTVFFQVPKIYTETETERNDSYSNELYSVMPLSSFVKDRWYTVISYGFDKDEVVAPVVLVQRPSVVDANMIVSDIQVAINKDGCAVDKITGYDINKNKIEILARDTGVAKAYGIDEGDFYAMTLYPDGTLEKAVHIYDQEKGISSTYNGYAYNNSVFGRFGYAYDLNSNFLLLSDKADDLTNRKVLNTSSSSVFIVDSDARNDIVKIGSLSDIQTFKRGGTAAKIAFFGSNSLSRVIVCYQ